MSSRDGKVVQARLTETEYLRFRLVAQEQGLSPSETFYRAVMAYVESKEEFGPDDPFFTFHDRVDSSGGEDTDASRMDSDLYTDK